MRRKGTIGLIGILAAGIVSFCAGRSLGSPRPQLEQTARAPWSFQTSGASTWVQAFGLEFKDDKGTIRFVKQFLWP